MVHTKGDPMSIADIKYMNAFVYFMMNLAVENNSKALDRLYALAMSLYGGRQFFVGPRLRFPYITGVIPTPPADQEG